MNKGILVVVSGFSGAGKGTVMKRLMEKYDGMNRLRRARACGVPVTNYGVAIAALTGILDKVAVPE